MVGFIKVCPPAGGRASIEAGAIAGQSAKVCGFDVLDNDIKYNVFKEDIIEVLMENEWYGVDKVQGECTVSNIKDYSKIDCILAIIRDICCVPSKIVVSLIA